MYILNWVQNRKTKVDSEIKYFPLLKIVAVARHLRQISSEIECVLYCISQQFQQRTTFSLFERRFRCFIRVKNRWLLIRLARTCQMLLNGLFNWPLRVKCFQWSNRLVGTFTYFEWSIRMVGACEMLSIAFGILVFTRPIRLICKCQNFQWPIRLVCTFQIFEVVYRLPYKCHMFSMDYPVAPYMSSVFIGVFDCSVRVKCFQWSIRLIRTCKFLKSSFRLVGACEMLSMIYPIDPYMSNIFNLFSIPKIVTSKYGIPKCIEQADFYNRLSGSYRYYQPNQQQWRLYLYSRYTGSIFLFLNFNIQIWRI